MLQQYLGIHKAVGVGITVNRDGTLLVNACCVSANANRLDFVTKISGLRSVEELTAHFPPKSLISLNINGRGVLHKQVEKVETLSQNNFSKIFPNANIEDFYVQNFISGDWSFISVIRRTDGNDIIEQLQQSGFTPVMLSLGPFPVFTVLPQLNLYDAELIFDGHQISRDEAGNWIKYQYHEAARSPFPIKAESEKIDEVLLLAYASAFQLVMSQRIEPVKADVETLEEALAETLSKKKLQVYGSVVLACTFLLLLVNFVLFSSLSADNAQLAYRVSSTAKNTSDVKNIQDSIKSKELELQQLGWDGGVSKARLIDQMAACLPPDIRWKQVDINPEDNNESRIQRTLIFKNRQIRVTGLSDKVIPVNEWIARIKTQHWVREVALDNYLFNSEANTGQFTITVSY